MANKTSVSVAVAPPSTATSTINSTNTVTSINYPAGIENSTFRTSLTFKRGDYFLGSNNPVENTKYFITLPIPKELNQFSSIGYNNTNMGAVMGLVDDVARDGFSKGSAEIERQIAHDYNVETLKKLSIVIGEKFLKYNNLSAGLSPVLARYSGFIKNPRMTELFAGVNLRNYFFSWHFSPDTASDSLVLRNLENVIQASIHPRESISGYILEFPFVCNVTHYFENNSSILVMPKELVVTDFRIFYVESDRGFYSDGQPIVSRIEMHLTEMSIRTAKDFVAGA